MYKEKFYTLMKECGFASLHKFCKASGIAPGNIHSNLRGHETLSIKRAFRIAKTLCVPIDAILEIFYPEEMDEVSKAIKK